MAKANSQKFIGRNRAPRVQIEYDVEVYGSEKKVQLPFVMGVMADLSGKPEPALPSVAERKFLSIDVDNFDARLKSMKPRVAFKVENTLTGEGNMAVDLSFESIDDFAPAAVARKVDALNKLLEARTQLSNLLTYMDGKTGAEQLLNNVLANPALLQALASTRGEPSGGAPASGGGKRRIGGGGTSPQGERIVPGAEDVGSAVPGAVIGPAQPAESAASDGIDLAEDDSSDPVSSASGDEDADPPHGDEGEEEEKEPDLDEVEESAADPDEGALPGGEEPSDPSDGEAPDSEADNSGSGDDGEPVSEADSTAPEPEDPTDKGSN